MYVTDEWTNSNPQFAEKDKQDKQGDIEEDSDAKTR